MFCEVWTVVWKDWIQGCDRRVIDQGKTQQGLSVEIPGLQNVPPYRVGGVISDNQNVK